MNISPLISYKVQHTHFSSYGRIVSFEPQRNKADGASLGIIYVKYGSPEAAQKCVAKEHGKMGATGFANEITIAEGEELKVVLDGEGKLLKAVLREMEARVNRRDGPTRMDRLFGSHVHPA